MKNPVFAALAVCAALCCASSSFAAPIEAYSRLPAMSNVAIADDGQRVAYITSHDRQSRVMVQQLDGTVLQALELGDVKLRDLEWADADHVVITTSTTDAVQNMTLVGELYQAVSLNVRTGHAVQLMSRSRGASRYLSVLAGSLVFGTWEGHPVAFAEAIEAIPDSTQIPRKDVVRVDLDTGILHQHQMGGQDTFAFETRRDGSVVAQEEYDTETGKWTLSIRNGGSWRNVRELTAPIDRPYLAGLTADGQSLLVDLWDDTNKVYRATPVSLTTGEFGAPPLPPRGVTIIDDHEDRMIGYMHQEVFSEYTFTDPARAATWARITSALQNRQVTLASYTPDFSRLIVYVEGTGFPGNYLLFDAAAGRLTQIGRAYPDIPNTDIAEVRAITYHAADGLEIDGYLTLPPGREPTHLALIVLPHGGPQVRDYAGFDWMAQSLASRGYAVLQPNFRGSGGYGRDFVEAGYGQWGRKMQTDLSDGVAYLAGRGMVDASRVCIMGASYGGYAALAGVTVQQGVYRCAVAIAPVSDVTEMLRWTTMRSGRESDTYRYWARYLGIQDPGDVPAEVSPVRMASHGTAPVLLIHGLDDTTVPYSQSTAMEHALRAAGRTVELVQLREEDHQLSREATRVQAMAAAVAFLERNNPPNAPPAH